MANKRQYDGVDFVLERIGDSSSRFYKAIIKASPYSITLTGAAVTKTLLIPFTHRMVSMKLYQTDSSHDANTDAVAVTFQRPKGSVPKQPYFVDVLFYDAAIAKSTIQENFGTTFEYEPSTWQLILDGTDTNIMELQIYVQKCEP